MYYRHPCDETLKNFLEWLTACGGSGGKPIQLKTSNRYILIFNRMLGGLPFSFTRDELLKRIEQQDAVHKAMTSRKAIWGKYEKFLAEAVVPVTGPPGLILDRLPAIGDYLSTLPRLGTSTVKEYLRAIERVVSTSADISEGALQNSLERYTPRFKHIIFGKNGLFTWIKSCDTLTAKTKVETEVETLWGDGTVAPQVNWHRVCSYLYTQITGQIVLPTSADKTKKEAGKVLQSQRVLQIGLEKAINDIAKELGISAVVPVATGDILNGSLALTLAKMIRETKPVQDAVDVQDAEDLVDDCWKRELQSLAGSHSDDFEAVKEALANKFLLVKVEWKDLLLLIGVPESDIPEQRSDRARLARVLWHVGIKNRTCP